jgi:hypothetical protein
LGVLLPDSQAVAQDDQTSDKQAQQGASGMSMVDMNAASMFLMNLASGTSENPAAWPMPMIMTRFGNWNTMFMGVGFLSDIQQSGPRGGDKLYSTDWSRCATNLAGIF